MCLGGGGGGDPSAYARQQEAERQKNITAGKKAIDAALSPSVFTPAFFGQRATAYENFMRPEVDREYKRYGDELAYALARAGLSSSTVASKSRGDLETQYDRNLLNVSNRGLDYAQQGRAELEQTRTELLNQLYASADPAGAAAQAGARASLLQSSPAFEPISIVFQNLAAGIGRPSYYYDDPYSRPFSSAGLFQDGGTKKARVVS